jgi:two-component system nitrogen regulation response regulator GlnG/two-component system response regulator HydG
VKTTSQVELPWRRADGSRKRELFHLVIAWSLDEPDRAGEAAPIDGPSVLGRGGAEAGDPAPRAVFYRQRPGESEPAGALRGARISRVQLTITPSGDELEVESLGRCAMLSRGVETKKAKVGPGQVLVLKNALVLLVVKRPAALPTLQCWRGTPFPFGGADEHGIVGESPAAWALRDSLALTAVADHHVLLQGESGVGKELAARALHGLSARRAKPLVARNAATFPEGLVDAELFGTARNYPNAGSPERQGLAGEADGSTLFLDEIGELPAQLQAHLLRLLDRGGEYQRLGESRPRKSDLRVVAATNRPLESLKHDLLARFAARMTVPGLEERREDIPLLARYLLREALAPHPELSTRLSGPAGEVRIDPDLIEALLLHSYTHHLRELERLLWLAASHSAGDFVELGPEVVAELHAPLREEVTEISAERIRAALQASAGNVTRAAEELGLRNRFALYRLMRRYGLGTDEA